MKENPIQEIKIILVGNDSNFISVVNMYLTKEIGNISATEISNCRMLLKYPNLNIFDVVLIDFELSSLNCREEITKLNFEYPNLKMIAISMHKDKFYLEDLICMGFRGFVYKPDFVASIEIVLNNVLNNVFDFKQLYNQ
ncbi:MAG TPA: hypothetical protein DDX39_06855 [Bacteroidales bacterium]|nr:MAG: hypothetical protein A2W98_15050 [Bacteroidetes bacterium GWF2_33_38]OFY89931.1 MAG: hypothetical protein A2236_12670 [Bacteroidetes bacterium RIFOXYA2_FULL_33_7]HBF88347.1 hypothetical protein [Bacteroidales bacterium]